MFGECHAHVIMDGLNYKKAVEMHADGVQEEVIHNCFREYQKRGITFVRDGGDSYGVSEKAREFAEMYGIDYRTPVFAIHKEGHYGSIVGKSFRNMKEYHGRVLEAKKAGADFIKIMTTGLMDFSNNGEITGTPLEKAEVKEMVHLAHEEGLAVMSHTNGVYGVNAAIEAGVDSIEHGNYLDEQTVSALADSESVWVPTLMPIRNLLGCGRFSDDVILNIMAKAERNIKLAYEKKAKVALGSDAGAYLVMHGQGIEEEYDAFLKILGEKEEVTDWLKQGEAVIKKTFKRV